MNIHWKVPHLNPLVTFLGFIDTTLIIPIIALYARSLGSDLGMIGFIVGTYSITNIISNILGGRLVDRLGYKLPLVIGFCGAAIAMSLYTLCQIPFHLALVRAFHGLGGGLIGPATMSVAAHQSSPESKGKTMSIYGAAIAAATLVGFAAGGSIASQFGFNMLFYIGSILLIIGVLLTFLMPHTNKHKAKQKQSNDTFLNSFKILTRNRLSISYLSIFAQYFSFGGIVSLLPLHIAEFNLGAFHIGMLLAIFSLMFVIIQVISGNLSDKTGRFKPIITALSIGIVVLALLPIANSFSTFALVMVVYGFGYGLLFPAICALLIDNTSIQEYGMATGIFHALITLGVAIGAPIMGWIAGYTGVKVGLNLIFIIFIPPLIVALISTRMDKGNTIAR